jgi:hypothetical protein
MNGGLARVRDTDPLANPSPDRGNCAHIPWKSPATRLSCRRSARARRPVEPDRLLHRGSLSTRSGIPHRAPRTIRSLGQLVQNLRAGSSRNDRKPGPRPSRRHPDAENEQSSDQRRKAPALLRRYRTAIGWITLEHVPEHCSCRFNSSPSTLRTIYNGVERFPACSRGAQNIIGYS